MATTRCETCGARRSEAIPVIAARVGAALPASYSGHASRFERDDVRVAVLRPREG